MNDDIPQHSFSIQTFDAVHASEADKRSLLELNKELRGDKADTDFDVFVKKNLYKSDLFVGRIGGVIKSAIILEKARPQTVWIRHNIVARDAGGLGLGKKMLARAIEEARASGAEKVRLVCNNVPSRNAARALYREAGFVSVNPVYETYKSKEGETVSVELYELTLNQ